MFLETMERVLGGTDKVHHRPERPSGQGVVPYLPLNDLQRRPSPQAGASQVRARARRREPPDESQALRTGILAPRRNRRDRPVRLDLHGPSDAAGPRAAVRRGATGPSREPGLYFKVPLVETVHYVDKRVLDLDLPVQTMLSADRQNLEVDAFARYRIIDPLRFYQSVDNVPRANQRAGELHQLGPAQRAGRRSPATPSCGPSARR